VEECKPLASGSVSPAFVPQPDNAEDTSYFVQKERRRRQGLTLVHLSSST
jgi:hypothetical protein